jgi:hypothetical protein
MKKILFAFSLFLFLFLFLTPQNTGKSYAATTSCNGGTGPCTKCLWDPFTSGGVCKVGTSTCAASGLAPNSAYCQGITNQSVCNSVAADCIQDISRCYECSLVQQACISHSIGDPKCQYDTFASCTSACKLTPLGNSSTCLTASGKTGIDTAIGCIPVFDQTSFLSTVLMWAVGIGGGIAFLLIIYAGFMIMTAAGNPERLKAGQELLTSALSGLILLVLSIFVLRFIGIDILGLGAFGFGATQTP